MSWRGFGGRNGGADFGESFVERERQFRFRKANEPQQSRAKSEVAEILSFGSIRDRYSTRRSSNVQRPESAYRTGGADYSGSSGYDQNQRPKSSFEPAASVNVSRSSRVLKNRPDDWCEIEPQGRRRFSDEDEEPLNSGDELDDDNDSREELSGYNFRKDQRQPPTSYQKTNAYGYYRNESGSSNAQQRRTILDFDDRELYYFGVIQLAPEKARQILSSNQPPAEYRTLTPIERTAFLYYFTLYRKYFSPVHVFHKVFNREFYKYTCYGDTEDTALWKICKHTQEEYKKRMIKRNQQAYHLTQKHLFSDERETPDSRISDRPSIRGDHEESDINSLDSTSKEPLLFRVPHAAFSFAVGGRIVLLQPDSSVSTVRIEDAKKFLLDPFNQRQIEALESFKGPLLVGETQPQTPLLFIQRQIDRILQSDVYRGNPNSGDANDCLLIWYLLETLVRQQGKVTGPDLAALLVSNYSYSSIKPGGTHVRGKSDKVYESGGGDLDEKRRDERSTDPYAMDKFTRYLLGGHIEEAIDSAMNDGLLFDALFLAHRVFKHDQRKLDEIEAKLLRFRKPQHPTMTLISVAAEQPVPLLMNATTDDDASGWRAHIAIVLANLQTDAAISTVYQLGLALAQKEFNSAADFCFLAVNLLKGFDCFQRTEDESSNIIGEESNQSRKHIKLISTSLPDDEIHSTSTRFGWSILDFQATEIYEYALKLGKYLNQQPQPSALSRSLEFQKCRLDYAKLLSEYGGFASNVSQYCMEVARSVWDYANNLQDKGFLEDLCDLAERFQHVSNRNPEELTWIPTLRAVASNSSTSTAPSQAQVQAQQQHYHPSLIKAPAVKIHTTQQQVVSNPPASSRPSRDSPPPAWTNSYFVAQPPKATSSPTPPPQQLAPTSSSRLEGQQQPETKKRTKRVSRTSGGSIEDVSPPRSPAASISSLNNVNELDVNNHYKHYSQHQNPNQQHHNIQHQQPATIPENQYMMSPPPPGNDLLYFPSPVAASSPYDFNHHQQQHQQQMGEEVPENNNYAGEDYTQGGNSFAYFQPTEDLYDTGSSPFVTSEYPTQPTHNSNNNASSRRSSIAQNEAHRDQQLHQQQQQSRKQSLPPKSNENEANSNGNANDNQSPSNGNKGGGFMGGFKSVFGSGLGLSKILPTGGGGKHMILPDDSKPTIYHDGEKWVGDVQEEVAPPPPPMVTGLAQSNTANATDPTATGNASEQPPQMMAMPSGDFSMPQVPIMPAGGSVSPVTVGGGGKGIKQNRYMNPGFF